MKLTKTLLAAVALVTVALPTTAQAQLNPSDVVGHLDSVAGDVIIERGGRYLRAQNMSAIMAGDTVFAKDGASAMARLNGCNGKFTPCDQLVSGGNKVSLGTGDYCNNLAALRPIGATDAVLTAGQVIAPTGVVGGGLAGAGGGLAGAGAGGILATAPALSPALLAIAGAATAFGAYKVIEDDEPSSP